MAYTAFRTKVPIEPSQLEKIHQAKAAYFHKLTLPSGEVIPDPLKISDWIKEVEGMGLWPDITYGDIVLYLKGKLGVDAGDTLNAYKEGKAYSYYVDNFVKEVQCKIVKLGTETYCILRTHVTRSMSMNEPPQQVWACLSVPGGEIQSAYCTCTAG